MKPQQILIVSVALLATACVDKYIEALDVVTENAKIAKKCQLKKAVSEKPKFECNSHALDIALDKARVLGIKNTRIQAAFDLGEKQAELENPNLVKKYKLLMLAADLDAPAANDPKVFAINSAYTAASAAAEAKAAKAMDRGDPLAANRAIYETIFLPRIDVATAESEAKAKEYRRKASEINTED